MNIQCIGTWRKNRDHVGLTHMAYSLQVPQALHTPLAVVGQIISHAMPSNCQAGERSQSHPNSPRLFSTSLQLPPQQNVPLVHRLHLSAAISKEARLCVSRDDIVSAPVLLAVCLARDVSTRLLHSAYTVRALACLGADLDRLGSQSKDRNKNQD